MNLTTIFMRKPNHVAIIPDGNRRYALSLGLTKVILLLKIFLKNYCLLQKEKNTGVEEQKLIF